MVAHAVSLPADSGGETLPVERAASAPSATAAAAVAPLPPGAALRELAAKPAPLVPAATPPRPVKGAQKDPDAELVAAVMAHSDLARRAAQPQPLNDVQRFQFALELKGCKTRAGQTAQDACVVAACEAKAYWGRTRSCPLPPQPARPKPLPPAQS